MAWDFGFWVRGFEFRVQGLEFRVWGLEIGVWGLPDVETRHGTTGTTQPTLRCKRVGVWGLGFWVLGFGLEPVTFIRVNFVLMMYVTC